MSTDLELAQIVDQACLNIQDPATRSAVEHAVSMASRLEKARLSQTQPAGEENASSPEGSDAEIVSAVLSAMENSPETEMDLENLRSLRRTSRPTEQHLGSPADSASPLNGSGAEPQLGSEDLKTLLSTMRQLVTDQQDPGSSSVAAAPQHSVVSADELRGTIDLAYQTVHLPFHGGLDQAASQISGLLLHNGPQSKKKGLTAFVRKRRVSIPGVLDRLRERQHPTEPRGQQHVNALLDHVHRDLHIRAASARRRPPRKTSTANRRQRPQTAALAADPLVGAPGEKIRPSSAGAKGRRAQFSLPFPTVFRPNPNLSCQSSKPIKLFEARRPTLADLAVEQSQRRAETVHQSDLAQQIPAILEPPSPRSRRPMGSTPQAKCIRESVLARKRIYVSHPSASTTALFNTRADRDDAFAESMKQIALQNKLPFDTVRRMYNKYESLCGTSTEGRFDRGRFFKILRYYNLTDKELAERMFEVLDEGRTGWVQFDKLVGCLVDIKSAPRRRQLDMLFRIVDLDGGGHIGVMEMFQFVLSRMKTVQRSTEAGVLEDLSTTLPTLNKNTLLSFVRKIFHALDADESGDISKEEFVEGIAESEHLWHAFQEMNPFRTLLRVRALDPGMNEREVERQESGFYETDQKEIAKIQEQEEHLEEQIRARSQMCATSSEGEKAETL